jgi:hypothetical protein
MHNQWQMDLDLDNMVCFMSPLAGLQRSNDTCHLIFDQASQQQSQFHTETGDMAQQFRPDDDDDDDDVADPGSHYDIERLLQWQSRHDNEQEGLGLPDDESSSEEEEEEEEEGLYNPMELDTAPSVSGAGQPAEADWLSYISRLSHLAKLDSMKTAMAYIEALKTASLDDKWSKLDADNLYRLQNPPTTPVDINDNPSWHLGLDLYLSITNVSQETYTSVRKAILRRYPNEGIPSYHQIKKYVAELSGVCSIEDDMCINSCIAYTGPWKDLQTCPECGKHRIDPFSKKPRQQLHTIPLGPQLQAIQ